MVDAIAALLMFLTVVLVLVTFVPTKGWGATRLAPLLMSILVLGVCSLVLLADFRDVGWFPLVAVAMAAAAIGSMVAAVVILYRHLCRSRRAVTVGAGRSEKITDEYR